MKGYLLNIQINFQKI